MDCTLPRGLLKAQQSAALHPLKLDTAGLATSAGGPDAAALSRSSEPTDFLHEPASASDDDSHASQPSTSPPAAADAPYVPGRIPAPPRPDYREGQRTLKDYNNFIDLLHQRRRSALIRDVYTEMKLDGVAPNWETFWLAINSSMKDRRLQDAIFFFQEMCRHGHPPSAASYTALVNTAGRAGHLSFALQLLEEMQARGLPLLAHTYKALMNAYAEAGEIEETRRILREMQDRNLPTDDFCYCAVINAYRYAGRKGGIPLNAARDIRALMREAHEQRLPFSSDMEGRPPPTSALLKTALGAYVALGFHKAALDMYKQLEGPDSFANGLLFSSLIKDAVGHYRMPDAEGLRIMMWHVKNPGGSEPEWVRQWRRAGGKRMPVEESMALFVSLKRQSEAPDADREASGSDTDDTLSWGPIAGEKSLEEEAPNASGRQEDMSDALVGQEDASDTLSGQEELPEALSEEEQMSEEQGAGSNNPTQRGEGSASTSQRPVLEGEAVLGDMAYLRHQIQKQYYSLESFREAHRLFRVMRSSGQLLTIDRIFDFILAGIKMRGAGLRNALDAVHEAIDFIQQKKQFIGVSMGSDIIREAVRPMVADLSVANRVWDLMLASGRVPNEESTKAFHAATEKRSWSDHKRLAEAKRVWAGHQNGEFEKAPAKTPNDFARHRVLQKAKRDQRRNGELARESVKMGRRSMDSRQRRA